MDGDLEVELSRLEQEGRTGVLSAGDGEFHVVDGAVAAACCRRATGLDRLVVEAGVATADDWERAGAGDAGRLLGRPRLETLAVLSVYDAACFLLASGATAEFRPAPAHWLSRICRVRPRELLRECARRGDNGPWSLHTVDRAPVVPVRRVRRQRVVLTAGQTEILAAADARRTVTEIARDLGRTTYGCLQAVRELTEAGLIEPPGRERGTATPPPGVRAAPGAVAPDVPEPEVVVPEASAPAASAPEVAAPESPAPDVVVPAVTATGGAPILSPAPSDPKPPLLLPFRRRSRQIVPVIEADRWEQVDVNLLVRVRAGLEELE
ncbi:winged helix-turn-helix domain-containing protein [Nocardia higoensis]|uniref:winged helix-turn-helix domain-containing protein n=1 Tax=Nocardia higoensis TaxID=228599 RepID=UPI0002FC3C1D|nr:winged helix-turn-helix domain-containing protein [Nocardia higoensis]